MTDLETSDGKQATIMLGTFGSVWGDNDSGKKCEIYMKGDQSGYDISKDCELEPWNDAFFHFADDQSEPDGIYGP